MQQFQPGMARAMVRACLVLKKSIKPVRIRMVNARPDELTCDSSSERPLPADLGEPASMQAACSVCYSLGCTRPAGSSRLASGKPPPMACPGATAACQRKSHFKVSYRCADWTLVGPRLQLLSS
jgi:hypothetical protein